MININASLNIAKRLFFFDSEVNAKYGTLDDPLDGGSSLSSVATWIISEMSRPYEQTLTTFKIYCSVGGTVKLKLLTPNNGGFLVNDFQTITCGVGLNTFTVADSTLTEIDIPANAMIGFKPGTATIRYTADAPAFNFGYMAATGDITGSHVITTSASYNHLLQVQVGTKFLRSSTVSDYFVSDDCTGNVLPSYGINNGTAPWTFSGGNLVNASIGLDDFLDFYPTTNSNDAYFKVQFRFLAAGDRFVIYRKPFINDAGALTGTIIEADLNNNKLIIYESWTGGTTYTLPAVESEVVLSNLTLSTGVTYEFEIRKDGKKVHAIITDTTNSNTQTLTVDNDTTKVSGLCYGRFGMAAIAGTINVSDVKIGNINTTPKFLIIGDSITEGSGATDNDTEGFAPLLLAAGDGRYSGEGGSLMFNILKRVRHELRLCKPKYVIIESVNNVNSAQEVTDYATQIVSVYQEIINAGATPIFCCPTPNSDATKNTRKETNRAFLLATYPNNVARTDLAISLNNDGSTYDASLMTDGVHPNTAGHLLMKNRILSDWPQIL